MSEEATETAEAVETTEAATTESAPELPKDIQEKLAELDRLKSHHSKLLDETKTAKQRAQELEEAQRQAEESQQKERGEFKELYEKTQAELQAEREARKKDREHKEASEIKSATVSAASKVAVDEKCSKLIAKELKEMAKYSEDGVKYEIGGIEVTEDQAIEHISTEYPRLVKGSGATGGGATGSGRPSGAGDSNAAADAAKSKGDLNGFLTAQLKQ